MTHRARSARLFVAVDPPEQVTERLREWARAAVAQIRSEQGVSQLPVRVLDAQLLHMTVLFLGERPLEQVPELSAQLQACARPSVELVVGAPLWLPTRRPRALAVELHDDEATLAHLHSEIVDRLEPAPAHVSAAPITHTHAKRFHPHITVARLRAQTGTTRSAANAVARQPLPPTPQLSFRPAELTLYRSWLSPEGASYEALASFTLGNLQAD
ncbi:MAG TPA: RNA 2',3'-cyclic phosphodiesterase [Solirubrobacteraceae bacterium]|nr:RNA 2',3'-cyclic phosphodiesterase [Solirubrobacteraceae bacterium]